MTLEEIKNILNDEHKKWSLDVGDWMGFVEELIDEVELLHKDGMTIYGMMEDGRAKAVATRCAEIANNKIKYNIKNKITGGSFNEGCSEVYEDICKEFNL